MNIVHNTPWYVPSVQVDTAPPWVNYVALYPKFLITFDKDPLNYYFPSRDSIPKVDRVIYPMGTWEPLFPFFDSSSYHDFLDVEFFIGGIC